MEPRYNLCYRDIDVPVFGMSSHQQLRALVEQLQREASMERMKTSDAIDQLKDYVREHEKDDYLCHPTRNPRANPFREKSICNIL
ncbi:guanine nucleotide-binding protein subunit gamma-1-like isoform X6 [Macrobrachium rosenbergii]|uniref:guanine nucleotide-binding protein subunit gamma-1-like isoform X6 n=1 Tax=Macrobrachium rosenbergii TaxID=79674 RepID=UPI0034D463A5